MPVESSGRTMTTPGKVFPKEVFLGITFWKIIFICEESEIAKLQQRLQLLRQEYVKLQNRLAEVERDHSTLAAMANGNLHHCKSCSFWTCLYFENNFLGSHKNGNSFASEILKKIGDLFKRNDYRYKENFLQSEILYR